MSKKNKIPWLADFRDPWTNIDFYHKLKLTKPGDILSKFLPSLSGKSKMSASDPNSAVYTTDSMEDIERKISYLYFNNKLKNQLKLKGLEHVKKFSWENTCSKTKSILNMI